MALTYRGPVVELQGQQFTPPEGVTGAKAAQWFEQQAAEQKARAEAKPRKVKITPQPTSREVERLNAIEADIDDLYEKLQSPDAMPLVAALSSISALNQASVATEEALQGLLERATEAKTANDLILAEAEAAAAEARQLKAEAMALVQQNQTLVAGAFNSFAKQLAGFRKDLAEADGELGIVRTETKNLAKSVKHASEITDAAVGIARDTANEVAEQQAQDFADFLSVVLRAMGVSQSDFNQALNAMEVTAGDQWLTAQYLAKAAAIRRSWDAAPGAVADVMTASEVDMPDQGPQLGN